MKASVLLSVVLFFFGLMAMNNYYGFFKWAIVLNDKSMMFVLGVVTILAGIIVLLRHIMLAFHKAF